MAASVNRVILVGHVGKDPESRSLQDGTQVVSFNLATGESWTDRSSGERREKTEWHRIVVMGNDHLTKIAADRVRKGSKIYVEGKVQTRKWQGQDGSDRYTTEILLGRFAASLFMLDAAWMPPAPSSTTWSRGPQHHLAHPGEPSTAPPRPATMAAWRQRLAPCGSGGAVLDPGLTLSITLLCCITTRLSIQST